MNPSLASRTRWLLAAVALLLLATVAVLTIEAATSQADAEARTAIVDPSGSVHRKIGVPSHIVLVGSSVKSLTTGGITRTCESNRYLVVAGGSLSWVEVTLHKPANQWNRAVRVVAVGWSSKPRQAC
ncbi:hypothetical protein ACPOLB_23505 [Rubrivivax sp. RP6-9]|uniref:hypothetical protein n=1 Tax=Rubrivivax sp. RP6-9 TaxID=3415750 RepID=UPI003CC683F5